MRPVRILWKPGVPIWQLKWAYRELDVSARAVWPARDGWWWVVWS